MVRKPGAFLVEQIAVSKFKATCLSVLQRVHKTRKPVLITRFGVPIAEVVPPPEPKRRILGCMEGIGHYYRGHCWSNHHL